MIPFPFQTGGFGLAGAAASGGPPPAGGEQFPVAFTQSTVYSGIAAADASNMQDANGNGDPVTGTGTDNGGTEWIKADLGSAKEICEVRIGFGVLSGWGTISSFTDGTTSLEYSLDNSAWTQIAAVRARPRTDSGTADRDLSFHFPPTSAQYWRITKAGYLGTATLRLFSPENPLEMVTGITYSQSSTYAGESAGSEANLNELPPVTTTGTATNNAIGQYIRVDLGSSRRVRLITLGTGVLSSFGGVGGYIAGGHKIQSSPDASAWTDELTIPNWWSGSDSAPNEWTFPFDVTARHFQIITTSNTWIGLTAFRLYADA
jgi:hypothetical protein